MYVNFLSTYSDKKSCHTSTTLQTSTARFVSDSWASCSLRYADLAILKMAAVRHLGFVLTSQYSIAEHIFVVQILSWNFILISVVVSEIRYLQYHKLAFWLYITDHGNFGVAHAYHVTLSRGGVQNNHLCEIFDPYFSIHYGTFMRLRWRLRGVVRGASPMLSDF